MLGTLWLLLAFACLAATGCSGSQPSQPAKADGRADPSNEPPAPARPRSVPPSAPTAQPAVSGPAPSVSPLRDLAARYLESDGHGGWRKNEQAATELEKLSAESAAQLWGLLKDPQVEVRRGVAVLLLSQLDPHNSEQVAAFTALLDDSDRMVRARALDAARQFTRGDQIAILPRLAAMLDAQREDRTENREAIARLCGALRGDATEALPALESATASDPDPKARAACLAAAAQIAASDQSVIFLAKGLADNDAAVRLVAAARLRQSGPAAAPAAKELANALGDSDGNVAEAAAEALIRIGAAAVHPLAGQLSSSSTSGRKLALACLAKLGPVAKAAIPAVEKCRQDTDPQVRQLAEAALMRLLGK
jgi:hypothetical protein